jgi:tripartite ATP-independent transporter DctP family solute receptor
MKRIGTIAVSAIVILLLFLIHTGCGGRVDSDSNAVPEFVFRYAENQAADYPTTLGANKFAELVEERTFGRIKIVVFSGAQLGSEAECIGQLRFGGIDFARFSLSQLAEISPPINVLHLPYLYRDEAHMWKVLDGEIGNNFLESLTTQNLIGLSWYNAGTRCFYTKVPIRKAEDLRGLTIRVQESTMMAEMVQLLGASPAPIVYSEVYSALKTGRIDGAENNWPSYESMLHYEVARYFYLDQHTRVPEMQVMSEVTMQKLSEADMEIIRECAKESALFEREEWARREKRSEEICREKGVKVTIPEPEDIQLMQTLCQPLYEKYAADYMDVVEQIIRLGQNK